MIGGGGRRVLTLAAREADVVGVNASLTAGYIGPEVVGTVTAEHFRRRMTGSERRPGLGSATSSCSA